MVFQCLSKEAKGGEKTLNGKKGLDFNNWELIGSWNLYIKGGWNEN